MKFCATRRLADVARDEKLDGMQLVVREGKAWRKVGIKFKHVYV